MKIEYNLHLYQGNGMTGKNIPYMEDTYGYGKVRKILAETQYDHGTTTLSKKDSN